MQGHDVLVPDSGCLVRHRGTTASSVRQASCGVETPPHLDAAKERVSPKQLLMPRVQVTKAAYDLMQLSTTRRRESAACSQARQRLGSLPGQCRSRQETKGLRCRSPPGGTPSPRHRWPWPSSSDPPPEARETGTIAWTRSLRREWVSFGGVERRERECEQGVARWADLCISHPCRRWCGQSQSHRL